MQTVSNFVNGAVFQRFVIGVILINAVILGLITTNVSPETLELLHLLDSICLTIFVAEIALKLVANRLDTFRDPWNVFDILVIGIALLPASGALSVLRALRVLRVMRLVTAIPSMRRVITGMFVAIPGGASVAAVLLVMYYVAAIVGVTLFRTDVPEHFGDLGTTFFTLFKMMTLEGWPDIAGQVIAKQPHSWIFFVVFIIFTTFTTLNLLFGIIVDAMEQAKEVDIREKMAAKGIPMGDQSAEVRLAVMEGELKAIRLAMDKLASKA